MSDPPIEHKILWGVIAALAVVLVVLVLSGCGADDGSGGGEHTYVHPAPPKPDGPASALGKACTEFGGVLDFEGREVDGYTVDWDVVCRDGTVRVVTAYTR